MIDMIDTNYNIADLDAKTIKNIYFSGLSIYF